MTTQMSHSCCHLQPLHSLATSQSCLICLSLPALSFRHSVQTPLPALAGNHVKEKVITETMVAGVPCRVVLVAETAADGSAARAAFEQLKPAHSNILLFTKEELAQQVRTALLHLERHGARYATAGFG